MENNQNHVSRKLIIKIAVPILIIMGLVAVWVIKNPSFLKQQNIGVAETSNPDFELHVTEEIDLEQLKSYGLPIIIDFGADYCAPCKEMAPVLEKLNKDLQGKAIIRFIDVEKYPELASGYPISVIPTQLLFDKEGNPYAASDNYSNGMIMYSNKETNEHAITTHEGGMTEELLLEILKDLGMEQ